MISSIHSIRSVAACPTRLKGPGCICIHVQPSATYGSKTRPADVVVEPPESDLFGQMISVAEFHWTDGIKRESASGGGVNARFGE